MSFIKAVQAATENGCFGDADLEKIELDKEKKKGFQMGSNLFFVKVLTGSEEKFLVVKTQSSFKIASEQIFRDSLFVNEVCFYSKLLPFLYKIDKNVINFLPKYYYGCATFGKDPTKDAVIVEDLSPMGFSISDLGRELDIAHITLALQTLGKFHALSYKAKQECPSVFEQLLSDLKNDTETVDDLLAAALYNAPNSYKGPQSSETKLRDVCCKNSLKAYQQSIIPKEPNAVLCHGDLCSNNMLFSYNKNGQPVELKLIDLQRCRYCSPAIDLSFFLLYNTTKCSRTHWDHFLQVYHQSLSTAYDDVVVPSFDQFMDDFKEHFIYGISMCSYFLHVISLSPQQLNDFMLTDKQEKVKIIGKIGGEKAFTLINEMFQLVFSKRCI